MWKVLKVSADLRFWKTEYSKRHPICVHQQICGRSRSCELYMESGSHTAMNSPPVVILQHTHHSTLYKWKRNRIPCGPNYEKTKSEDGDRSRGLAWWLSLRQKLTNLHYLLDISLVFFLPLWALNPSDQLNLWIWQVLNSKGGFKSIMVKIAQGFAEFQPL